MIISLISTISKRSFYQEYVCRIMILINLYDDFLMTIIIEPRKEKVERESVQNQTNQKPIKQTKPATIKKIKS